jgi:hypothetical protein
MTTAVGNLEPTITSRHDNIATPFSKAPLIQRGDHRHADDDECGCVRTDDGECGCLRDRASGPSSSD